MKPPDAGLLSPQLSAGIRRLKGAKRIGLRLGNWLTADQKPGCDSGAEAPSLNGRREKAMLALGCRCAMLNR